MRKVLTYFVSIGFCILFNMSVSVKINTAMQNRVNMEIRSKLMEEDRGAPSIDEVADAEWEFDAEEDSSYINELMERYDTEKFK
jgi:hypothetical protein